MIILPIYEIRVLHYTEQGGENAIFFSDLDLKF